MGATGRTALFFGSGQDAISAECAVALFGMTLPWDNVHPGQPVVQGAGDLGLHATAAAKRMGATVRWSPPTPRGTGGPRRSSSRPSSVSGWIAHGRGCGDTGPDRPPACARMSDVHRIAERRGGPSRRGRDARRPVRGPELRSLGSGRRYRLEGIDASFIDAAFADAVSHEDAEYPVLDLAPGGLA